MGHVFVPVALVLGLGVMAVEVQHPPQRPAESSGKSVSQAPRPRAQVKREG